MNYTIRVLDKLNSDYFSLLKQYKDEHKPISILNDINYDDYWIYKSTGKQREVCKEDVLNMKYATFIFFHKNHFDIDFISKWISFFNTKIYLQFLIKPFPPYDPNKKIIIKK